MTRQYLLGFDVGSSSVKASLVDIDSGQCAASAFYPETEAPIKAVKSGWAEQDPNMWWENAKRALATIMGQTACKGSDIRAIGISYQMHGLVCVDRNLNPLRDSIIWCDSRAIRYGEQAFDRLGADYCLSHLLNSPGNFTAAKLAWVRSNEPQCFERIYKILLPGDYLAMRLSGETCTTISGLSEGIFWDFKERKVSQPLLDEFGISQSLIPHVVPTFGIQGRVTAQAAAETGLAEGTPIAYRAGDQPNNALSLNVLNPGEIAATAGTSGVVYGVLGKVDYDPKSRVGTFAHVNYTPSTTRLGVLLCVNGTGCLNSWIHRNMAPDLTYPEMNQLASMAPIGSDGVTIIPFGNGAERVLENQETGCDIQGINFNKHNRSHIIRAAQEGIVFSFCYGMEIMRGMGMNIKKINAGNANMFLSPLFRQTLASTTGATINLYQTDGSVGAAKGAGMGCGIYKDSNEAFATLKKLHVVEPEANKESLYQEAYGRWKEALDNKLDNKLS